MCASCQSWGGLEAKKLLVRTDENALVDSQSNSKGVYGSDVLLITT